MPHFKCVPCRTRLRSAEVHADQVGDACPDCGAELEPVVDLTDVVGYRSIRSRQVTPEDVTSNLGDLAVALATRAQVERLAINRWRDDGGSVAAQAALAPSIQPRMKT